MDARSTILVVDDNPTNREIYHEILADKFTVLTACSGMEALGLARTSQPSVVLLDVILPDLDGYDVCRRLRRLPGMRGALIIMVSAKALASDRAMGMDAGADDYLTTPFEESALLAALDSAPLKPKGNDHSQLGLSRTGH